MVLNFVSLFFCESYLFLISSVFAFFKDIHVKLGKEADCVCKKGYTGDEFTCNKKLTVKETFSLRIEGDEMHKCFFQYDSIQGSLYLNDIRRNDFIRCLEFGWETDKVNLKDSDFVCDTYPEYQFPQILFACFASKL